MAERLITLGGGSTLAFEREAPREDPEALGRRTADRLAEALLAGRDFDPGDVYDASEILGPSEERLERDRRRLHQTHMESTLQAEGARAEAAQLAQLASRRGRL